MKPSGIGGQAVIEGVMMKNQDVYAVAVRKPDQAIEVKKEEYKSIQKKYAVLRLPIIRGVVTFVESLVIGMKTLTYSAGFYEEEDTKPTKVEESFGKVFKGKAESVIMGLTILFSIVLAVAIFMILPFFIAELFNKITDDSTLLALIEGAVRLLVFIAYVGAISCMKDIKRVFMYHGAEHKTINCVESGLPLTVENVRKQSKQHKRCGTSFLFLVMFISIIFFLFIRVENIWLRVAFRVLLVPVIAGISYEFIRLAGRSESGIVNLLSKPGLWLQGMTTREPDDSMIEVAIASVEAVFDWKTYQEEQGGLDENKEPEKKRAGLYVVSGNDSPKNKKKSEESKQDGEKPQAGKNERKQEKAKKRQRSAVPEQKKETSKKTGGNSNKKETVQKNPVKQEENKNTAEQKKPAKTKERAVIQQAVRTEDKKPESKEKKKQEEETAAAKDDIAPAIKPEKTRQEILHPQISYHSTPDLLSDEEDDEILNALDKYFVFEEEKKEP